MREHDCTKESDHYLLYVTKYDILFNERRLIAYEYYGKDVFHAMGEIQYRSIEQIYRITYVKYSESSIKFITDNNIPLHRWYNKYKGGDLDDGAES